MLAIQTHNLCKRYGKTQAVRSLNLEVQVGRIYGFLGPNGAGKSTTIRMLMGLIRPTRGEVRLLGGRVGLNGPPAAARVGALVEGPAFADYLSARRNLQMLADLSGGAETGRIDQVLELVGLAHRQKDRVRTYSHGMKQRLGLAQALIPRPRLLILDEPAQGLDPQGLAEIRELLRRLRDEEQITIFLSSHLLHEVELICDDVGVIVRGELIASGEVEQLLRGKPGAVAVQVNDVAKAKEVAAALPFVQSVSVGRSGHQTATGEGGLPTPTGPGRSGHQTATGVADGGPAPSLHLIVEPDRIADLNTALVGAGLQVSSLVPDRPSLESVYLELMAQDEANDPRGGCEVGPDGPRRLPQPDEGAARPAAPDATPAATDNDETAH
jgi:ABC-2 type transport system ATP-binding protein